MVGTYNMGSVRIVSLKVRKNKFKTINPIAILSVFKKSSVKIPVGYPIPRVVDNTCSRQRWRKIHPPLLTKLNLNPQNRHFSMLSSHYVLFCF